MKFKESDVSIIIPNWNGKKLLEKYLPTVIEACRGSQIIISDDASTDNSVQFIKAKFPGISIVEKQMNEGFSSTVNEGVKAATGAIVVLLNTDIEPEKDFLTYLLPHFDDDMVFAVGCMDKSEEHGHIQERGRGESCWKKGFFIHKRGETDKSSTAWVSGGSGAFRKSYWTKLRGLDEIFNPFYWEDIDLSYRAKKSGYKILFESKSVVIHRHEEGSIKSQKNQQDITKVAFRNQLFFIWKNISDSQYLCEHFFWLPIRLFQSLMTRDKLFFLAFLLALKKLPVIITGRRKNARMFSIPDKELVLRNYS